jgi:uncharacterized protein (DUF1684 family)
LIRQTTTRGVGRPLSRPRTSGGAEFQLHGQVHRVDAIKEGDGSFFVFRDATAGNATYAASHFLDIDKGPKANGSFTLDFNKACNPPAPFPLAVRRGRNVVGQDSATRMAIQSGLLRRQGPTAARIA